MEMATVELGGYELRNDSVFATDNFFQMLGLATPEPLTPRSFRNALSRIAHSSLYRTTDAGNSVFIVQKEDEVRYVILRVTRICGETASEVGLLEDVTIPTLEQQRITSYNGSHSKIVTSFFHFPTRRASQHSKKAPFRALSLQCCYFRFLISFIPASTAAYSTPATAQMIQLYRGWPLPLGPKV